MEINVRVNELPKLTKIQKKEISKVTNRYLRIKTNRVKRKIISILKLNG